jgi:hypothetical protein
MILYKIIPLVVWKHSWLHQFLSLGSSDFHVFFRLFYGIFVCGLIHRFWGICVFVWFPLRESWIDVLCIFVLDLDTSKAGFGFRFADFGWNPILVLQLDDLSIPDDLFGLMLQDFGNSISRRCFFFPHNVVSIHAAVTTQHVITCLALHHEHDCLLWQNSCVCLNVISF